MSDEVGVECKVCLDYVDLDCTVLVPAEGEEDEDTHICCVCAVLEEDAKKSPMDKLAAQLQAALIRAETAERRFDELKIAASEALERQARQFGRMAQQASDDVEDGAADVADNDYNQWRALLDKTGMPYEERQPYFKEGEKQTWGEAPENTAFYLDIKRSGRICFDAQHQLLGIETWDPPYFLARRGVPHDDSEGKNNAGQDTGSSDQEPGDQDQAR